jgi:NADPH:quinone reductase-like Zn-dependent oxidoreductase
MRQWWCRSWGQLELEASGPPDPTGSGCLVAWQGYALNYRDWLMLRGAYDARVLPYVPLSDAAGVVVEASGELQVGDRVLPCFSPDWLEGEVTPLAVRRTRGGPVPGVLAEVQRLPAAELVRAPGHLDPVEAASLVCAGTTAWRALTVLGRVQPGQTVLVLGSGGVATWAALLAQALGARVLVVSRSPGKVAAWRGLGVTEVLPAEPGWGKRLRGTVDLVIEVGGAGTLEESLQAARVGGTVALIGVLAGGAGTVNLTPVLMKQIKVQGVFVGSKADLSALVAFVEGHQLRPPVGEVVPFEQAPKAWERLASGQAFGKVGILGAARA